MAVAVLAVAKRLEGDGERTEAVGVELTAIAICGGWGYNVLFKRRPGRGGAGPPSGTAQQGTATNVLIVNPSPLI